MAIEIEKIVRNVLNGKVDDFEYLVIEYQKLVYHIVNRMIDQPQDREDIFQDIFFRAYKNLQTFRFESKFSTWIGRIAYNACINYLQKNRIPLTSDKGSGTESAHHFADRAGDPDSESEKRICNELLQKEISKLSPTHRTLITLYHLDGMKYSEIASITAMPVGTVKNYLFRARQALKNRLRSQYQLEDLI